MKKANVTMNLLVWNKRVSGSKLLRNYWEKMKIVEKILRKNEDNTLKIKEKEKRSIWSMWLLIIFLIFGLFIKKVPKK